MTIGFNRQRGCIECRLPRLSRSVTFPAPSECELDFSNVQVSRVRDQGVIKIPILRDTRFEDASSQTTDLIPSSELHARHYGILKCRFCLHPLTRGPPQRVLPMPSSYWQEVTDLWYCHNETKLAPLTERPISAIQGVYLAG